MKAWREVSVPHPDVLEGTFQQSEFAADITAVRSGELDDQLAQTSRQKAPPKSRKAA